MRCLRVLTTSLVIVENRGFLPLGAIEAACRFFDENRKTRRAAAAGVREAVGGHPDTAEDAVDCGRTLRYQQSATAALTCSRGNDDGLFKREESKSGAAGTHKGHGHKEHKQPDKLVLMAT